MLCTNCRAKIPNDTQIGPYCGYKIENYSFPNTYHNPSSTVNISNGSSTISKITIFVIAGIIMVSTFVTTVVAVDPGYPRGDGTNEENWHVKIFYEKHFLPG